MEIPFNEEEMQDESQTTGENTNRQGTNMLVFDQM